MEQHEVDGILQEAQRARDAAKNPAKPPLLTVPVAIMLVAGIAAVGAFATLFAVWFRSTTPGQTETLRIALDEYVAGRYEVARQLAERVDPDVEEDVDNYKVREFLLGAAGVHLASELEEPDKMRLEIAAAVPHLEWLVEVGFPPGRNSEGQRLLGLGLRALGRYGAAIIPLEVAISEDPTLTRELMLPLAECKLRATGVKVTRAEEDVKNFLQLPKLPDESKEDAYLLLARIETKMRDFSKARRTLSKIKDEALRDNVDFLLADIAIEEAKNIVADHKRLFPSAKGTPLAATELLGDATGLLEELSRRNDIEFGAPARYLAGISYRIAGKNEEALGVLSSLRQNNKFPAEAIAAGIEEVELLAEMGLYADALLATRAIVRSIGDPITFDPKWISLIDLQARLQTVGQTIRVGGGYQESIEYAESLPPVVDPADALAMKAQSHREWGLFLRAKGKAGNEEAMRDARRQFREAGSTFAEVAKLEFTEPEYIDLLWEAIAAYQAGRAYEESLELLNDYLRYEDRSRIPRGLVAKGKALAAIGKHEEALIPFEDCIAEFRRDPLSYEAQLLSAVSNAELGRIERAREKLEGNVQNEWLSPESPVYRDSLFVLGDLLYRTATEEFLRLTTPSTVSPRLSPGDRPRPEDVEAFQKNQLVLESAIVRLEEAEQRDIKSGNVERSRRAGYLAAEAHRLASFWPAIQAADAETLQSNRNRLNQQRLAELRRANETFERLRKQLTDRMSEQSELSPWEQSMRRNCYMGVADTYFEMGDIEGALAAYQKASQEFMNEPFALEALMQESRCLEQLGKTAEAKNVFKKASLVLSRIPEEEAGRFAQTTRYNREDWSELLQWLEDT